MELEPPSENNLFSIINNMLNNLRDLIKLMFFMHSVDCKFYVIMHQMVMLFPFEGRVVKGVQNWVLLNYNKMYCIHNWWQYQDKKINAFY